MRLGFDLDEVIVNLTAEFERYLKDTYKIEWPIDCFVSYHFDECVFVPDDEEKNNIVVADLLQQVKDPDVYLNAKPYKDAAQVLTELKRRGHKIYLISSRPKQLQPTTFKWLRNNDIPFDDLKVIGRSVPKGFYGRKLYLDSFVDDYEPNLESLLKYKSRWRKGLMLMDRPWNRGSIDGSKFKRIHNWQEILRHIGISNR